MNELPSRVDGPADAGSLQGRTVVLIGGGSGIGLRVAHQAVAMRRPCHPRRAYPGTPHRSGAGTGQPCDMADRGHHRPFLARLILRGTRPRRPPVHLRSLLSRRAHDEIERRRCREPLRLQVLGSVPRGQVCRAQVVGGRIRRPDVRCRRARPPAAAPAYAACNAAIEGLGRGLAVELAPVRVNVVSPGTIDGNLWAHRAEEDREAAFSQYRRDSILRRLGTEDEIAQNVLFLFTNGFTTGATLYPDGGYTLR